MQSPVSRLRRSMANDASQHIDLITELQKHNSVVANKHANKQATKQSPVKMSNTTTAIANNMKDMSDDTAYSDFDDDDIYEEEKRVSHVRRRRSVQ